MLNKIFHKLRFFLTDTFWIMPGLMVLGGVLAAMGLIELDKSGLLSSALVNSAWLYDSGGTGARTLLGTVASSTLGVAGTVFSTTIAAIKLLARPGDAKRPARRTATLRLPPNPFLETP